MLLRRGRARLSPAQAHQRASHGQAVLLDVREATGRAGQRAPGGLHPPPSRRLAGAPPPLAARARAATPVTGGVTG
ncbi:hypothetical protein [Wenjunlia vitaminophila]|nr:hypothetical protein [Wenjunlia vitaminophila]